jgi:hypothetical protein
LSGFLFRFALAFCVVKFLFDLVNELLVPELRFD